MGGQKEWGGTGHGGVTGWGGLCGGEEWGLWGQKWGLGGYWGLKWGRGGGLYGSGGSLWVSVGLGVSLTPVLLGGPQLETTVMGVLCVLLGPLWVWGGLYGSGGGVPMGLQGALWVSTGPGRSLWVP